MTKDNIRTVLVANRGEIARRLFRACRELGIRSVAAHADPDAGSCWCSQADLSVRLPGASVSETYLNPNAILAAANEVGADAVHPGYGFLSENAAFAEACAESGLVFIGPRPETMRALGSKAGARRIAESVGVPVIPGADGEGRSDGELAAIADRIGYPIMIKASDGGGGRGMRVVESPSELAAALRAARAESQAAFGSEHVLLEKFVSPARHVEVQLLGDNHGNLVHLYERECSIQRRNQKLIEESPASHVDERLRREMAEAAVAVGREARYSSVGTIEFLLDDDGRYYFLEANTRLQVEHPVTEMVTGIDLAEWQIRVAAGERLPFRQADVSQRGHAIECRIYAEDPGRGFLPSSGTISIYRPPAGPGVRVDDGISGGSAVSTLYEGLLAKVITSGWDRKEALRRMRQALAETVLLGVTTNIPYLQDVIDDAQFRSGDISTQFLERRFAGWQAPVALTDSDWLAIAAFESLSPAATVGEPTNGSNGHAGDPWVMAGGWRNVP